MIFHMNPSYEFAMDVNKKIIYKMILNSTSHTDLSQSKRQLAVILYESGFQVRTNYTTSDGVCSTIVNHIKELEELN